MAEVYTAILRRLFDFIEIQFKIHKVSLLLITGIRRDNMGLVSEKVNSTAKFYLFVGSLFQFMFISAGACRAVMLMQADDIHWPSIARTSGYVGAMIFGYHLFYLYIGKKEGLVTDGMFKYTRHPMYTGAALIGIHAWWPTRIDFSPAYWVTLVCFAIGLIVAGYLQEQETLERFGDEAREYYRKTPRLFLWYPFMRR